MRQSTRRTAGEGSIYFNAARERWEGKVDLDAGPDGVRRRNTVTGRTKTAVVKKVKELVRAAEAGQDIGAKSKTVAEVADDWLAKVAAVDLEPSTLDVTAKLVRGHIIPGVGRHPVAKLRPGHVEQWLEAEAATGKAKATLSKYRTTLSRILRWAMARQLVTWNVAAVAAVPLYGLESHDLPPLGLRLT